jgi:hypothetical protein
VVLNYADLADSADPADLPPSVSFFPAACPFFEGNGATIQVSREGSAVAVSPLQKRRREGG